MSTATKAIAHPVIGELRPWAMLAYCPNLDNGYDEFETPTMQGLARVPNPNRLNLLVIDAKNPGHGDCGRFLAECCAAYETVCVWHVMNPDLDAMLERRGFREVVEVEGGEINRGRRWDSSSRPEGRASSEETT